MSNKYYLIPLDLEVKAKNIIDEFLTKNPTQKVVIIGHYIGSDTAERGHTSIANAQGQLIAKGFFDGLANSEKKLAAFILNADLPTQVTEELENKMLENGVLGFSDSKKLKKHLDETFSIF